MRTFFVVIGVVVCTSFGCGKTGGGNPIGPGSVGSMTKVTVIDQVSGAPISGIRVSTSSEEGITGADGTVSINLSMEQKFSASDGGSYFYRTDIWRGTPVQMFKVPVGIDKESLKQELYFEWPRNSGIFAIRRPAKWPVYLQLGVPEVQTPDFIVRAETAVDQLNAQYGQTVYMVSRDGFVPNGNLGCQIIIRDPRFNGKSGTSFAMADSRNGGIITGIIYNIEDPSRVTVLDLVRNLRTTIGLNADSSSVAMVVHGTLPPGTMWEYDTSNIR